MLPWESICVILMGQEGLSPFRPADYRFSSCASKPYQLGDQVQERRCEDDFDGRLAAVLFLMVSKGMPSFIYHYKLNGIDCQEKTEKENRAAPPGDSISRY